MTPGTVLIADDSSAIREIVKLTLQFKKYDVLEAKDGAEAYEILSTTPCDLLITDLDMPGMSGLELLDKTRKDLKNESLPVVVCTAESSVKDKDIVSRGANAVLRKPISPMQLLELVGRLVK